MRQTRTKFLSVLLTLALVLGLLPSLTTPASAYSGAGTKNDPYVVTDYDELRELMRSVSEDDPVCYIELGRDITESGNQNSYYLYVQNGGNVVLDLAGYRLTRSALTTDSRLIGVQGGNLTVNDSVGGGEIVCETRNGGYGYSGAGILVENWDGSKLTVNSGTIVGGEYGIYTQGGTTVINGGTFLVLNPETTLAMGSKPGYFVSGTVAVCGGTFGDSASNNTTIVIKNADVMFYNICTAYYGMYSRNNSWPSLKGVTVTVDGTKFRPQGNYFMGNSVEGRIGAKIVISGPDMTIDTVEISGIDAPVTGQPLDFTADCDTIGVKSVSVYWYNLSDNKTVSKGEVAQAGKTYRVDVDLLPQAGYQFVGDKSEAVTINGEEAYIFGGTTDDLSVSYIFSETAAGKPAISTVSITGLDALKHGQAADYTASTSTSGCTVKKIEYQMFRKTMTDYVPIDGDNVAVVVTVSAADGYEFASGSTATWNGLKSDDTVAGLNAKEKRYAFYIEVKADASQIVKSAAMTVTAPEIGKAPSTAVTGTGVEASSVKWSPADAMFQAGTAYTVSFTLKADAAHVLADDFKNAGTVTVNGQKAVLTSTVKGKFVTYTVSYTFPALKTGEISNVAVTGIDAPVFGKTPDKSAVVPADAQYTVAAVSWDPACDSFLGNSVYSVLVSLESKDGMKFATVPAVTINGETAKVVSGAGSEELKVSYIFPKTTAAYDLITNTYSTTDVTATLKEYVAVSVYTDLPDMAKNIKYQWYKTASNNYGTGTAISGATAAGYAIPTEAEGTMYYYCVVTASVDGKTVTSDSSDSPLIKVTVKKGLPAITAQPKSVTVKPGADVTFSVAATGEALNYQWWRETKSGASKVGTNGPTYTIKAVNIPDDNGTAYYCVVSNKAGEVTSDKAKLTVSELGAMTAFSDVPEGAYYTDAVAWAVEKGVTSGTSSTTFSPNADCTRAQIVTFLWRAAGSPAPKSKESSFADVAADAYYSDAVRWAVENGITSGTSATTFSPNATCTRAQTVTFLWRSQKSPADGAANAFTDVAEGTYYTDAVKWAVKNGITSGTGTNTFSPNADCSRAQIVTFLHRCMAK